MRSFRLPGLPSAAMLLTLAAMGCTPTATPPADDAAADAKAAAANSAAGAGQPVPEHVPAPAGDGREETWMACYINSNKIGYTHLTMTPVTENAQPAIRWDYEDELRIRRFGAETVVRTRLTSLETRDGELLSFRSEMNTGPGTVITEGRCEGGQLTLCDTTQGKADRRTIAWDKQYGGFFADQFSLRRKPMRPGESRQLRALVPVINQVGTIRLEAVAYEATELPAGTQTLLRIDVATDFGSAQLKSILWTDEQGTPQKGKDLQLGMEAFLTTREDALKPGTAGEFDPVFDLGFDTIVRVDRPLPEPHGTRRVVYRAQLKDGDVKSLFAEGLTQAVRPLDDGRVEVTVQAVRPGQPPTVPDQQQDSPTDADRQPSTLLQSDDAEIVKISQSVAAQESDPWKIACALERHVKATIRLKNYSTAMATAAEVARSLEGDCTEHAMLLAALCRARQIPARVAIGLVYYPFAGGFAYHMWTEVWIKDRWIPLDATLGLGGIGGAHLKLAHSSMQGTGAYAEMLPVVQALGRLKLEIVSTE